MLDVARLSSPRDLIPAGPDTFIVGHGDDRGLVVKFYAEPVHQPFESEKAGRPIFKDVDFIHMFLPGGKTDVKRPVKLEDDERSPSDPNRFPRQWEAFKNQKEEVHDGTPLEHCAFIPRARVMELKAQQIHTLEQLAMIPDSAFDRLGMDIRSLRDKAKALLANADQNAKVLSLQSENDQLKADMAALKQQFNEFAKAHVKKEK